MDLTITRSYYYPGDVVDGDYPRDDVEYEEHPYLGAAEAAALLIANGLSFAATGADWAGDPDGSRTVDYATGRQVEVTGHISKCPERLLAAIIRKVG